MYSAYSRCFPGVRALKAASSFEFSLKGSKYKVTGDVRYGGIAETISKCSDDVNGELIFVNRSGESKISARLFGSVPGALVQIANVPVIVVP